MGKDCVSIFWREFGCLSSSLKIAVPCFLFSPLQLFISGLDHYSTIATYLHDKEHRDHLVYPVNHFVETPQFLSNVLRIIILKYLEILGNLYIANWLVQCAFRRQWRTTHCNTSKYVKTYTFWLPVYGFP